MKEPEILMEVVKKARLTASSHYDLYQLQSAGEHFLPLTWQEKEEEWEFSYDVTGMHPFTEIRREPKEVIFSILIQIAWFLKGSVAYSFSIEPSNWYYNRNGRVCIKTRDLIGDQQVSKEQFLLLPYQALCACVLTGTYTYQDYIEGGKELMGKTKSTEVLLSMATISEIQEYLEKKQEEYLHNQKAQKVIVSKKANITWKIVMAVLGVITIALSVYSSRQYFARMPYLTAVIEADQAYIEEDSVKLIDALKGIEIGQLDIHQKLILSRAYLQSENLSDGQKENRIEKLSLHSNEKELDYWIALGRMDAKTGEDLAKQLFDDELLLYAYLKDKEQVQSDNTLSGSEKEELLEALTGKIDALKEKYNLDEETKETDS